MTAPPPPKVRRPNFTRGEMLCIVNEVKERETVIAGKFDYKAGITHERKEMAWKAVTKAVNAISQVPRTASEVRAKYKDMRAQCKAKYSKKLRHMSGTGGGPPLDVKFTEVEEALLEMISPTAVTGLPFEDSEDPPICGGARVSVYRRCLYCNNGQEGVQHVGRWRASDARLNTLFFGKDEQFRSFNGHRFKIVSTSYIPYIDFRRDRDEPGTTVTPTFSVEAFILEEFAKRVNFSYVMREQPDGEWGRRMDGGFNGMMGQLERQEVDFCTLCGITYNRNKVIDHLHNYPSDPITVVSLKPSLLPQHFLLVRPLAAEGLQRKWKSSKNCFMRELA